MLEQGCGAMQNGAHAMQNGAHAMRPYVPPSKNICSFAPC